MKKILKIALIIIVLITVGCFYYLNDYYHASKQALSLVDDYVFEGNSDIGIIFYPGGKVEAESYAPLLNELSKHDVTCLLLQMPFNLAVFDIDAAKGYKQQYPHIKHWYLAGHSLGGSMAASYLSSCEEQYDGLILLASYSTSDLSNKDYHILSIYGSNDQVLNKKKYQDNKEHLGYCLEYVIEGGNHAYFGDYGEQKGDGIASISRNGQIQETVNYIISNIKGPLNNGIE